MVENKPIKPELQQNVRSAYNIYEVIDYFNKKYDIELSVEGGEKSFWHWMLGETDIIKGRNFSINIRECNDIPDFAQKVIDILLKEGFDDEEEGVFVFYYGD